MKELINEFKYVIARAYEEPEKQDTWFEEADIIAEKIYSKCISRYNANKYLESLAKKAFEKA